MNDAQMPEIEALARPTITNIHASPPERIDCGRFDRLGPGATIV